VWSTIAAGRRDISLKVSGLYHAANVGLTGHDTAAAALASRTELEADLWTVTAGGRVVGNSRCESQAASRPGSLSSRVVVGLWMLLSRDRVAGNGAGLIRRAGGLLDRHP
jgi:hypothetical protein